MREKYIFFTLLFIAAIMLVGARLGRKTEGKVTTQEQQLKNKLKTTGAREPALAQKIDLDKIRNLLPFSYYEPLLKRSLFVQVKDRPVQTATGALVLPVEEKTPTFVYKGKIAAGSRLLVIIEQTRSGEVFMVAKGENLDGYKVLDITDTEVILSKKDAENIVLKTIEKP
ncbi:MAG: hypothetical protein JW714_03010 [Candidatus Omnitrophica bacterium]|nr:hypothetical protein [Candidatus Omnitrophota bacterium]